jgi:hypothetical protein
VVQPPSVRTNYEISKERVRRAAVKPSRIWNVSLPPNPRTAGVNE